MPCEQVHFRDARSMSCWQKVRVISIWLFHAAFPVLPNSKHGWLFVHLVQFIMNNPFNIKKSQQHCFDSWFGPTEFFWSWEIGSLPLCTLPLRFRVVLVDPCFITCDDTAQNVILPVQKVMVYGTVPKAYPLYDVFSSCAPGQTSNTHNSKPQG